MECFSVKKTVCRVCTQYMTSDILLIQSLGSILSENVLRFLRKCNFKIRSPSAPPWPSFWVIPYSKEYQIHDGANKLRAAMQPVQQSCWCQTETSTEPVQTWKKNKSDKGCVHVWTAEQLQSTEWKQLSWEFILNSKHVWVWVIGMAKGTFYLKQSHF